MTSSIWRSISTAPFGRDLKLAVIDQGEVHALVFACRRVVGGWIKSDSNERLKIHPTHWRPWQNDDDPTNA